MLSAWTPRNLAYRLLNRLNHLWRTGYRRYEFERLYLESEDPWNYRTSAYEAEKYHHILACAAQWRSGSKRALEIGCSIGVFSAQLAEAFDEVTAIDISKEALAVAKQHNHAARNLEFLRRDVRSLSLGREYDVIFCAEVLYYLPRSATASVCRVLSRHLGGRGMIILVTGPSSNEESFLQFNNWKQALSAAFKPVFAESVQDPRRPYEITVFARRE